MTHSYSSLPLVVRTTALTNNTTGNNMEITFGNLPPCYPIHCHILHQQQQQQQKQQSLQSTSVNRRRGGLHWSRCPSRFEPGSYFCTPKLKRDSCCSCGTRGKSESLALQPDVLSRNLHFTCFRTNSFTRRLPFFVVLEVLITGFFSKVLWYRIIGIPHFT